MTKTSRHRDEGQQAQTEIGQIPEGVEGKEDEEQEAGRRRQGGAHHRNEIA
jgi:hypothetical protein